jgi:uncharacterized protein (TIGR02271 family)
MAKTVIGLFDDRAEAQRVVQSLIFGGFHDKDISVISKDVKMKEVEVEYVEEEGDEQVRDMAKGAGTGAAIGGMAALLAGLAALAIPGVGPVLAVGPLLAAAIAGAGIGATTGGLISGLMRLGLSQDEAHTYAEGLRRGATLVSVNCPDEGAERAITIMKRHGAVEIDKRAAQWREEGWTGFDESSLAQQPASYATGDATNARTGLDSEVTAEHEPIRLESAGQGEIAVPVIEEKLQVDKREVDRGGIRLQSRVTETPVEENVELREEHVHVERRPVDYTFHGTEMEAFKEGMVEIREAYEELIVNKKARVVEEVIVGKDVEQRTETVRETLRRTDVDVEPIEPESSRVAAASSSNNNDQQDGPSNT